MNVPYHSARFEGKIARAIYASLLPVIARRQIAVERQLPFDVFSYSGQNTLPEQVASIRSFLAYAGRPKQFTVVSDGSYTNASARLLERIDNCVQVQTTVPPLPPGLTAETERYLRNHPTGKQFALMMALPLNGPTLYTDSDVLFFGGAPQLARLFQTQSVPAFYLRDYQFSGDDRLILNEAEKADPVNTGFLFLFRKLDWSVALERLKMLKGEPIFFTNQTLTHLCLHANGATPFDPQKFVLQADDQFIYRDRYTGNSIAMRHYVNPVRHKFWAAIARQLFH